MWNRIMETIDSLLWFIVLAVGVGGVIWLYFAFATVGMTRGERGQ